MLITKNLTLPFISTECLQVLPGNIWVGVPFLLHFLLSSNFLLTPLKLESLGLEMAVKPNGY